MGSGGVLRRVSNWTVGPLTLTLSLRGEGISQRELRAVGVGRILQVETSSFEDEA